ncbi:MAG: hypothetical protein JSS02_31725 [Planctomycetes bacterium]|nr:hypothetical protein [Planctomycetota bacterium]
MRPGSKKLCVGFAVAAGAWVVYTALYPRIGNFADCGCSASVHGWWFESTPPTRRGVVVNCSNSAVTDAELKMGINRLRSLSPVYIDLSGSAISDESAANLSELPSLLHLNVGATNITDAGLSHFSRLDRLHTLEVDGSMLTDRGCRNVAQIASLKRLLVTGPQIDDGVVDRIVKLLSKNRNIHVLLYNSTISSGVRKQIEQSEVFGRLSISTSIRTSEP